MVPLKLSEPKIEDYDDEDLDEEFDEEDEDDV